MLTMVMGIAFLLSPFCVVKCIVNPVISFTGLTDEEDDALYYLCNEDGQINELIYDAGYFKSGDSLFPYFSYKYDAVRQSATVTVDISRYQKYEQAARQEIMQITIDTIMASQLSRTNKTRLYNFISNTDEEISNLIRQLSTDVRTDFGRAYATFKPFSSTLGWILGVAVLGLFIILTLTIIIDICYITIPILQISSDSAKKPKFVSREAYEAVKNSESKDGSFKAPIWGYFGNKTGQLIAVSICILYLSSGKIFGLLATIIDYFSGLVD